MGTGIPDEVSGVSAVAECGRRSEMEKAEKIPEMAEKEVSVKVEAGKGGKTGGRTAGPGRACRPRTGAEHGKSGRRSG